MGKTEQGKSDKMELPITDEVLGITKDLQIKCLDTYLETMGELEAGQNEAQIAKRIREKLDKRGIVDFWYNVPIFVLFGVERFMTTGEKSYDIKNPKRNRILEGGDPVFIDMHVRDIESGVWGDFSATVIYKPIFQEQVDFLAEVQNIQNQTIAEISSETTPNQLASSFLRRFDLAGITPVDVLNNFGHIIGRGEKNSWSRIFIDTETETPTMANAIWGIEPGGYMDTLQGRVVGRFETCVWVSPSGRVIDLTGNPQLPLFV